MIPEAGARESYASAVGELWSGLAGTLTRLEALALAPEQLTVDEGLDELRRLQYALHSASEDAVGLRPPPGVDAAHDELAAALAEAREATGELAEAIEHDGAGALETRLYEWRGALFRIRLARLRLARRGERARARDDAPAPARATAAAALALTLGGTLAFLLGAAAGSWPLWAFGAVAVCSSLLVYRS